MSARTVISPGQVRAAIVALLLAAGAGWCWGFAALVLANSVLVAAMAAVTVWRLWAGVLSLGRPPPPPPALPPDAVLPTYTVLVPMYREAAAVGGLVAHLARLDYPVERLQILLLTEADDDATIAAAQQAAAPHPHIAVVVVPPGTPRTKPRACNHGLGLATGELLVVFDAEDRPEPDQLRLAAAAFAAGGDGLGCVQAGLDCYDARTSWLTRLFAAEYAAWFAGYLPGLERLGAPVPLGGTSNHLRTAALRRLNGWDAWNVAEDCDLGMRLAQAGLRTGIIPSTTWEEATDRPSTWLRQRSRWCKGWAQTWIVHARLPLATLTGMGWARAVQMHALLGSTVLSQLLTPPCWLLLALWLLGWGEWMRGLFPPAITGLALTLLVAGNALNILHAMAACLRRGHNHLVPWCLLLPVTWFLAGIAAWRGVLQLVGSPFVWEKTMHAGPQAGSQPVPAPVATATATAATAPAAGSAEASTPLPAALPEAVRPDRWRWWWLLLPPALLAVLLVCGPGEPALMRLGTLHDLAADLDLGRQTLLASPWLLPLPTLLMAPLAWLPADWPWLAMNALLLGAAGIALAGLLGSRWAATVLTLTATALLAPTAQVDLLPMLACALLALAAQRQQDPPRRTLAAPAWAAAAACHPLGLVLALLALIAIRGRNWRLLLATGLAYAAVVWLLALHLVFGGWPLRRDLRWWPPPRDAAAAARADLAQLLDGPLAGRAVIVVGPAGYLLEDLLRSRDGRIVGDLHPDSLPPWERREAVLLLPTPANPLRAWLERADPAVLEAAFERSTPMWQVWSCRPPE